MRPKSTDLVVTPWGARFRGRRLPCATGISGIGEKTCEGDGLSPAGCFRIVAVLYRPDRVRLHVPGHSGHRPRRQVPRWSVDVPCPPGATTWTRKIGPRDIWSDDPLDPAYNRHVSAVGGVEYAYRHERLWRADPMYDLVAVLDFNLRDPVPGHGSAIFLHAWRSPRHPTAGCVAFPKEVLMEIITSWSPGSLVHIHR